MSTRHVVLALMSLLMAGCVVQGGQSTDGTAEGGKMNNNITIPVTVTNGQSGTNNQMSQMGYRCYSPMNGAPMCMMNQPGLIRGSCYCMSPYGPQQGLIGP